MPDITVVEDYRFRRADLRAAGRPPGISAFMRTRNGADFIEPVIRSHIDHFDEIVVVFNRCTDDTAAILARLKPIYGERLKVFDYRPPVFPPGSREHARTPADASESVINYSNFVLAETRYATAVKLDDDHLAIGPAVAALTRRIRAGELPPDELWCFSGVNLGADETGRIGVTAFNPLVGLGDHCYFHVTADSYFRHDRRFERFNAAGRHRVFRGFLYWHLKHLKRAHGYGHYDIEKGNDRFRRKRDEYLANRAVIDLAALRHRAPRRWQLLRPVMPLEKVALRADAWHAIATGAVTDADLAAALSTLTMPTREPALAS